MIEGKECGLIVIDELNQPWTEETYNKLADITEYINADANATVRAAKFAALYGGTLGGSMIHTIQQYARDEPVEAATESTPKPQKWKGDFARGSEAKMARRAQLKRGKR